MAQSFLGSCKAFLLSEWRLISYLNVLFYGVVFGSALLAGFLLAPPLVSGQPPLVLPEYVVGNGILLFLFIFVSNLGFSAFAVVTLPGLVFFPLSAVALAYRGVLWGLLFFSLSLKSFVVLLPVAVLEGEAYVIAAATGMIAGFSWVRPSESMSRTQSLRGTLKRGLWAYVLVVLLLLIAAVVETMIVMLSGTML